MRARARQMPSWVRHKWGRAPNIKALTLPRPNAFIPADLSLKAAANEDINAYPQGPLLISETPKWRLHHKQDRRYPPHNIRDPPCANPATRNVVSDLCLHCAPCRQPLLAATPPKHGSI